MWKNLKDMKLKRKNKILLSSLVVVLLFLIVTNSSKNYKIEILKNMKNGLEDESLVNHYWEYIRGAKELSNVPVIIRYFDIDLNKDEVDDKIVVLIGPPFFHFSWRHS